MRKNKKLMNIVLSALFIALAYVLPFLTGQIPDIGNMLCPMHLPVLLCGFVCGWQYGLAVGVISPLLRSLTISMPALFPRAVCMAIELAAYGAVAGLMYKLLPKKKTYIYLSLVIAMIAGRIVWGFAMYLCMGFLGKSFGFSYFLAEAFLNALPGIILQLIIIPVVVMLLKKK
jgi:thiamine transporter ThiT